MKKSLLFVVAAASILALSSCRSVVEMVSATARTAEAINQPVMCDLTVSEQKVEYTYTMVPQVGGPFSYATANTAKADAMLEEYAVYEALNSVKGDVLVCPQYKIVRKIEDNKVKLITVYVTGYIGRYSNFRAATPAAPEIKELKNDASYLIINKDIDGTPTYYKVVSHAKNNVLEFDLNDIDLEKVILGQKGKKK